MGGAEFLDGDERVRHRRLDVSHHVGRVFSGHDGVEYVDRAVPSPSLQFRHDVSLLAERARRIAIRLVWDNGPYDDGAERQPVLHQNAHVVPGGESGGISHHVVDRIEVLERLPDGDDPDEHFHKPDGRRHPPVSPHGDHDPKRSHRHVDDAERKDEKRTVRQGKKSIH